MTTIEAFAPAKINLALHVTGRREDGYHLLDSLVVFAKDIGDEVRVTDAPEFSLKVSGPMAEGVPIDERNIALKAAGILAEARAPSRSASIELTKYIPNGAGLGGGSMDAAATLVSLAELWGVKLFSRIRAGVEIGADVSVCMSAPLPARMSGIGSQVLSVDRLPQLWLVLANPGVHLPTSEVFRRLSTHFSVDNAPMDDLPRTLEFKEFEEWLQRQRNDLTQVMNGFCPEVVECLDVLHGLSGCRKADMSGSGSTCWGLFETADEAINAARVLSGIKPDWWVRTTEIEEVRFIPYIPTFRRIPLS